MLKIIKLHMVNSLFNILTHMYSNTQKHFVGIMGSCAKHFTASNAMVCVSIVLDIFKHMLLIYINIGDW